MCTDAKREVCWTEYKPNFCPSIYLSFYPFIYLTIYHRCVQMPKEKYVGQNINQTLSICLSLNLSIYLLSIYYRCVPMPREKYVGQNISPAVLKVIMGSSVGWSRILLAKFFWQGYQVIMFYFSRMPKFRQTISEIFGFL